MGLRIRADEGDLASESLVIGGGSVEHLQMFTEHGDGSELPTFEVCARARPPPVGADRPCAQTAAA